MSVILADRVCEQCGRVYSPYHARQRYCRYICQQDFRNAEARAARKFFADAGKPQDRIQEELHHDAA